MACSWACRLEFGQAAFVELKLEIVMCCTFVV